MLIKHQDIIPKLKLINIGSGYLTVLSKKKLYDGTVTLNKKLDDSIRKKGREGGWT